MLAVSQTSREDSARGPVLFANKCNNCGRAFGYLPRQFSTESNGMSAGMQPFLSLDDLGGRQRENRPEPPKFETVQRLPVSEGGLSFVLQRQYDPALSEAW